MSVEVISSSYDWVRIIAYTSIPILVLVCLFASKTFRNQETGNKAFTAFVAVLVSFFIAAVYGSISMILTDSQDRALTCESVEETYGVSFIDDCNSSVIEGRESEPALLVPGFSSAQTGRFVQLEDGALIKLEIVFEGKFVPVEDVP